MRKFYSNRQQDMMMFLGQTQKYKDTDFKKRFNNDLLSNTLQFDKTHSEFLKNKSTTLRGEVETMQANSFSRPDEQEYREMNSIKFNSV